MGGRGPGGGREDEADWRNQAPQAAKPYEWDNSALQSTINYPNTTFTNL